jgi:arsenite methyltransferase
MEKSAEELKAIVKEKYSTIARTSTPGCCQPSCDCSSSGNFAEDYSTLEGYVAEADFSLGCGIPTNVAQIKEGHRVLDLGSGAGNDVFVARSIVGESGFVIGVDMSEAMIERANANKQKLGLKNVEFRLGEIEQLPVESASVDVVLSNCVLNLVPDKHKGFKEIYRVLQPGGRFSISDVVLDGELPSQLQQAAEMYAGCVSGALQRDSYLKIIEEIGFENLSIPKEKRVTLPDETLRAYLSPEELVRFKASGAGILSITVTATKPRD